MATSFFLNAWNQIVQKNLIILSHLYVLGHHRQNPKGAAMKRMFSLIKKKDKQLIIEM